MSLREPSARRGLPVSLRQIRAEVRVKAAHQMLVAHAADGEDVLAAAMFPSATVYWIAESARDLLAEVAA